MPDMKETVRALIGAFNVNNYDFNAIKTNFTLQSNGKGSYIVVSFDKGMSEDQCREYLDNIKRRIVGEFYGIEEGDTDEVVLNTAKLIFNIESFPFNTSKGKWSQDEQGRVEFLAPIDKGVIFNLKSHLASSLKKDVIEGMPACRIVTKASNKKRYLWHGIFPNKELRKKFEHEFLSRMRERYENIPKNPLEVEGNSVYIKDVFNDTHFVDSIIRRAAWRIGRDLQADSKSRGDVRTFKNLIMEFINQPEGLIANGFVCAPPLNGKGASILIPVILDSKGFRTLTNKEALSINGAFDNAVFVDIDGKTQAELPVNGSSGIYGINFYDQKISHCVITKIIESSVINAKHELSIDPELPRTLLTEASPESPTRNQNVALKGSPRQGFIGAHRGLVSVDQVDVPGMSREFPPSTWMSSTAVSYGVAGPSSSPQSLSAAQNVSAWTSQPIGYWSSSTSSAGSRKGAAQNVQVGPSAWPSPTPSAGPSSSRGANESMRAGRSTWYVSSSVVEDVNDVEPEKQQVSDGCSEAKSQKSESPEKQHGGGWFCKERKKLSPLKRNNEERSSIYSSKSDLVYHVTEKPSMSKPSLTFPTKIKAKGNPPSGVTSPTHEGGSEWQQRLDPDQREELCKVLPPEKEKQLHPNLPFEAKRGLLFKFFGDEQEISGNASTSSKDSGLGKSLERGQSPSLIEKFNDKSLINSRVDSPNIKKHSQEEKGVLV